MASTTCSMTGVTCCAGPRRLPTSSSTGGAPMPGHGILPGIPPKTPTDTAIQTFSSPPWTTDPTTEDTIKTPCQIGSASRLKSKGSQGAALNPKPTASGLAEFPGHAAIPGISHPAGPGTTGQSAPSLSGKTRVPSTYAHNRALPRSALSCGNAEKEEAAQGFPFLLADYRNLCHKTESESNHPRCCRPRFHGRRVDPYERSSLSLSGRTRHCRAKA